MKFKKYVKESFDEKEDFVEDLGNPDAPSIIKDEIDNFYAPVEKLIKAGKFDEAKSELDALESDLDEFESENAKKKIFKFPQFMIDGQRKQLAALRAKLPANESISDMERRCEKCNTLLNDGGTCPKCDDGEEDYGDEKDDSLDNDQQQDLKEEMSATEKLIAAFPDVDWNFDNKIEESYLTEAQGAEVKSKVKTALDSIAQEDKNSLAGKVSQIADMIPDNLADDVFAKIKGAFGNIKLNPAQKKQVVQDSGDLITVEDADEVNTVGDLVDAIDSSEAGDKNPEAVKSSLVGILQVVAVIEPTPVVDFITAVVAALPANIVSKVVGFLGKFSPVMKAVSNMSEDMTTTDAKSKLIAAFPDVDWNFRENTIDETLTEETDPEDDWYDDDYDIDDVEEDRRHAALYGGERTYCSCGKKLVRTEWGSYCPECDPETAQEEHEKSVYDDDEIDEGFLSSLSVPAAGSLAGKAPANKLSEENSDCTK